MLHFKIDWLSSQKPNFSYLDINLANFDMLYIVNPNMKVDSKWEFLQDFTQEYIRPTQTSCNLKSWLMLSYNAHKRDFFIHFYDL